ncbi:helix-turn-helix transcriptional regulator [Paenibacillus sp. FSL R5-0636]|uniref:Transcriptional regulator n=1 Tax=Paenibacillus odorifer TaxID=189426 RepID=A0AB36J4U8_9BACL|nr:helix-turn-helix transcriptional regulator [Paenibacillus odorifer]OMC99907.1 transcriptional regulator [Paenibacillus odorifer]OME07062.1 transcriptional regulator [Paenibacillus odorifer]OME09725.1 transcriptional regulator [Paenibacillus odorifer]
MIRSFRGNCLLQSILNSQEMTPAEFARRSGWSSRMVYYWCDNSKPMSVEAMHTASLILGVPMEALYTWKVVEKD